MSQEGGSARVASSATNDENLTAHNPPSSEARHYYCDDATNSDLFEINENNSRQITLSARLEQETFDPKNRACIIRTSLDELPETDEKENDFLEELDKMPFCKLEIQTKE